MNPTTTKTTTTAKIKSNLIYYIIAVVVATAFFAFETVVPVSTEVSSLKAEWKTNQKASRQALEQVKNGASSTPLYQTYKTKKQATDAAYAKYKAAKKNVKFLAFDNFQQFLGEFGWAFGLFIYAFFLLIKTFLERSDTYKGEIVLHSTLLFISFSFLSWCFLRRDFLAYEYVILNSVSVSAIILATYYLLLSRDEKEKKYRATIKMLFTYIYDVEKYTPADEKEQESIKRGELIKTTLENVGR